ncbi:hypothetical protein MJO28_008163 [Puccinia striiformis f. sp. tritici]|uniref:Uncharacterized protein n=1 Tax=Puccinia striiformis f. sp. tritici TaxID=168172 RepID=A0ACC0EA87_9BASI|nr:hypothetical protein MJO28_017232 [Puccinia striiformis f. sp. tritici]KAI7949342.1 hypothetical protein MJO28_008163 [Puccinia striiformis f. sp. tritici]KAI7952438.1 hypothetical protein MJO29_008069 [Puccinia striiformis f. sp. tritici]
MKNDHAAFVPHSQEQSKSFANKIINQIGQCVALRPATAASNGYRYNIGLKEKAGSACNPRMNPMIFFRLTSIPDGHQKGGYHDIIVG